MIAFEPDLVVGMVDGRPVYDNTATVVSVLLRHEGTPIAIRRAKNPGKGKLGLCGGFQMYGETWQEAGVREVYEEVGLILDPRSLNFIHMKTDSYQNNWVLATYCADPFGALDPDVNEVQEVAKFASPDTFAMNKDVWAFEHHRLAMLDYLTGAV